MNQLTSWTLDEGSVIRREPPRPVDARQPSYLDEHDDRTLFYDAFRAPDGDRAVLIGPPLHNLVSYFEAMVVHRSPGEAPLTFSVVHRDRNAQIWVDGGGSADRVRLVGLPFGEPARARDLPLQPNQSGLFAGRRTIVTLSKNNELAWIFDWARFYRRAHGVDGILFYDNGSTKYALAEIQCTLERAAAGARCIVVSWPFKFGPGGGPALNWDSDYCKYAMLEHARWRYLAHARSVLNVDIDELVVSPNRASIFASVETSPLGYLLLPGCWIVNERAATRFARFRDFTYREQVPNATQKWCVVPRRCAFDRDWRIHEVSGFPKEAVPENQFMLRHFKAISTSWKYERFHPVVIDPERHVVDRALVEQLAEFLD